MTRTRSGPGSGGEPTRSAARGPAGVDRTLVRYLPPWRIEVTTRAGREGSPAGGLVCRSTGGVGRQPAGGRDLLPAGSHGLLPAAAIARLVFGALHAAGAPGPASIGIILSDDDELSALNWQAMGNEGPTDVLSFPLLPPEAFPAHPGRARPGGAGVPPAFALPPRQRPHLGDVVVSVERAIEQAYGGRGGQTADVAWDPADELALLVVHGCLHVCGWDHAEPDEEAAMRSLERHLLTRWHERDVGTNRAAGVRREAAPGRRAPPVGHEAAPGAPR